MSAPGRLDAQITFLYYRDLEPAARFYASVLGLDLVEDQGWAKIFRVSQAAFVGVVDERAGSRRASADAGVLLTLLVDDVHAWAAHLESSGVAIVRGPEVNESIGVECCFVEDPGGYLIELQRFTRPAVAAVFGQRPR